MEHVIIKNKRRKNIIGTYYHAGKKLVILCHGFLGDKSEWGRFDKFAHVLSKKGYSVLSFDFTGSGESSDEVINIEKEIADLHSVIGYALKKGHHDIALVGLSLGGYVALKNYSKNIHTIILWAPVTQSMDRIPHWLRKRSAQKLFEIATKGYFTIHARKGARKKYQIDKNMIMERRTIIPQDYLPKVHCNVLIIHGDQDDTIPLLHSKQALQYLKHSHLHIIKEADHGFYEHLPEVFSTTLAWLKKHM